jgi:energy-coupling factor transporter transmembrane protein EcfT
VKTPVHPRTAFALAAAGVGASLAGWRSAVVVLVCLCLFLLSTASRRIVLGLAPLLGAFLALLVLLPFAPKAVVTVAVRGVAASLSLVTAAWSTTWPATLGDLAGLGLPRTAVAFLALLARHLETMRETAQRTGAALQLRGAFDRWTHVPRAVSVLLGRLLFLAFARADRVADAMALRGFEGRLAPPRPWRPRLGEARHYAAILVLVAAMLWETAS